MNSRPSHPQCDALTKLRYGPTVWGDANGAGAIDNLFRARLFDLEHDGGEIIGLMVLRLVRAAGMVQAADELADLV